MKRALAFILWLCLGFLAGAEPGGPSAVLFHRVRVFDGRSEQLTPESDVLVRGNRIARISQAELAESADVRVEGRGRVLMPGLVDCHWHAFLGPATIADLVDGDEGYLHTLAAVEARDTLLRGFTTVRDAAGPVFGLKRAIDQKICWGPRIYPSGAMISQTSGHGDFRPRGEKNTQLSMVEKLGCSFVADGVEEVRRAVREQLRLGATQIKLAAGGGVASLYDPLDVSQYSLEEMKAAVDSARDWGTYVMVHVYTPEGIRRALAAGVRCIEHGHLCDEDTMRLLVEKGAWICVQPFTDTVRPQYDAVRNEKLRQVAAGTSNVFQLAKKYHAQLAFGTDRLFSKKSCSEQNKEILKLSQWFSTPEILRLVTSQNASLLALAGARNPYPGQLGVVEEGAYADLLLVEGNPMENLALLGDPEKNLAVIMKDGVLYKNR